MAGVNVACVYMTKETDEAFCAAWTLLWQAVEEVTGRPVRHCHHPYKGVVL